MACLFLKGKKSEVESVKQISDLNSQSVAKKVEGKKKRDAAVCIYVRNLGHTGTVFLKEIS